MEALPQSGVLAGGGGRRRGVVLLGSVGMKVEVMSVEAPRGGGSGKRRRGRRKEVGGGGGGTLRCLISMDRRAESSFKKVRETELARDE